MDFIDQTFTILLREGQKDQHPQGWALATTVATTWQCLNALSLVFVLV